MADWFTSFYEAERRRFEAWLEAAREAMQQFGFEDVRISLSWMPGVGGVARIVGFCPRARRTFERWVDTALAYSFAGDWLRFCLWFTSGTECSGPPAEHYIPERPGYEISWLYAAVTRRYVDANKARAVSGALKVLYAS